MQKYNKLKKYLIVLCGFVLVYALASRCTSEERTLEKHCGEFVTADFEEVNWNRPSEKVIGENIAKEFARDVDSLRNYTMLPVEKYHLDNMYCNAGTMHAIKDAQHRMSPDGAVDIFEGMPARGVINGNITTKFLRETYEEKVPGSVTVIHMEENPKMSKMEKAFKKMNPGSYVRYHGHYNNGNSHRHTQMYLGQGYCDDGCFVPSRRGKTVMAACYNNAFKYLEKDINEKYSKNNTGEPGSPILDSIVIIDVPAIMAYKAKQK
jgi:hypothetical protein